MDSKQIDVMVADASHEVYVDKILDTIREAAKVRGTGIAERTHEYVATKMKEGKAIIALCGDDFAGFTYIESWGNKQYVATSGLIVHPKYRGLGLAKRIKTASFRLARLRWPNAKVFSLTSGAAVMKMNTELVAVLSLYLLLPLKKSGTPLFLVHPPAEYQFDMYTVFYQNAQRYRFPNSFFSYSILYLPSR